MVKLYNIAVSFSIFTLQALAAIKPFSEPCRAAFDDFETFNEEIIGDDCNSIDENIIDLGLRNGNLTKDFIDKFSTYESLKTLSLIRFEFVSEDVNLESLHLSQFNFNALSSAKKNRYLGISFPGSILKTLKNVETINLRGIHITQETLNSLSSLKNVKNIKLVDSGIDNELDFSVLSKNKNLVSLQLDVYPTEPQIEKFPESLCKIKKLKELNLNENPISSIPSCIKNLKSLEILKMEDANLNSFPKELTKVTSLKELYLYNNNITTIASSIEDLYKLEKLDLSYNSIKKIPSSLCELTKLKYLDLNSNDGISKIPSCFEDFSKIKHLALGNNNITSIPSSFYTFKKLEVLDMSANKIEKVSSNLKKLTKLKELYLNSNALTKIPDVFDKIPNLEKLNLAFNQITDLPQSIGKLTKLTELYLNNNQITGTIPEGLNNAVNLKYFYINENVNIKGRTLTNPDLLYCRYILGNTITDEICLDPGTLWRDVSEDIQPC